MESRSKHTITMPNAIGLPILSSSSAASSSGPVVITRLSASNRPCFVASASVDFHADTFALKPSGLLVLRGRKSEYSEVIRDRWNSEWLRMKVDSDGGEVREVI